MSWILLFWISPKFFWNIPSKALASVLIFMHFATRLIRHDAPRFTITRFTTIRAEGSPFKVYVDVLNSISDKEWFELSLPTPSVQSYKKNVLLNGLNFQLNLPAQLPPSPDKVKSPTQRKEPRALARLRWWLKYFAKLGNSEPLLCFVHMTQLT